MPAVAADNTLATQYEIEYLSRWQKIQKVQSIQIQIQRLENNRARIEQGIHQQQKDIERNKTFIEKTNVRRLTEDIGKLQEILARQEPICKSVVGKEKEERDLETRHVLIERIKVDIDKKEALIEEIKQSPDGILPQVKSIQQFVLQQENNLKKLQQQFADIKKKLASKKAELKELNLTHYSDTSYVQFFQKKLAKEIARTLDNAFAGLSSVKHRV